MSTEKLKMYLEKVRDNTLNRDGSLYHSFFCVVMSHGNEVRLHLFTNDFINMNSFKNKHTKKGIQLYI